MRLIRTATLELEEFIDDEIPNYAILSHTWGREEVSFADFDKPESRQKAGYGKIVQCCSLARSRDHDFVWIDTCCIDKSSSSELSEAINSMYNWYFDAEECFAYLSDVQKEPSEQTWLLQFRASRWFTRGWTLQELLAPPALFFYDSNWVELGTKSLLAEHIESITKIRPYNFITDPRDASIAQRMFWASGRQTTRVEDRAYCLLGLFDINMPLLYGERKEAFTRLQLEIIKKYDDESIFAWMNDDYPRGGMLARSPADFLRSGDIVKSRVLAYRSRKAYSYTNRGLEFQVIGWKGRAFSSAQDGDILEIDSDWIAPISCARSTGGMAPLVLYFQYAKDGFPHVVQRVHLDRLDSVHESILPQRTSTLYVAQDFTPAYKIPLRLLTEAWQRRVLGGRTMREIEEDGDPMAPVAGEDFNRYTAVLNRTGVGYSSNPRLRDIQCALSYQGSLRANLP
ncbi:MAG: hypothetical protein L6R39_002118 [Caloplaca ligustica]|nr:MAG: hypothetical protein L6R39_002118 [Caloplaca ligustica]